ncbi:MAG: hypothetical protein ABIL22_01385 [candidate division WOR-3 bacterium]
MERKEIIKRICILLSFGYVFFFVHASHLDELLALSKGDMASLQLNLYASAAWQVSLLQYDVFIYSFFDRKDTSIVIELYGMKEKVDDAQKAIENFRVLVKSEFIPFFKNNYGIALDEVNEIKFVYRNRTEEGRKEVYLWEKGKYRYPIK